MRQSLALTTSLALLLALALGGCGGSSTEDAGQPLVARVDGRPVTLLEYTRYLRLSVDEDDAEIGDEVRSRLLDSLLLEHLMAIDAEEAGFQVSDDEVELRVAELDMDQDGTAGGGEISAAYLERLRRSLLVDRFLAERIVGPVEVSEEEVQEGAQREDGPGGQGPMVVYRQAMTESREDALEILRRVRRGREPFDQVAAQLSLSPDGAAPQWALVGQLPPDVGRVLAGGPRGEVVGPVAVGCSGGAGEEGCVYYVFLIENREESGLPGARTADEIREALRREKQAQRLEAYRRELMGSGRIQVLEENLPFRYVPAEAAPAEGAPEEAS